MVIISMHTIQTSAANVQTGIADEYVRLYAPLFNPSYILQFAVKYLKIGSLIF